MMLVTHRGPYRFSVRDDGSFAPRRGAGGLVSALLPLVQRDDIGGPAVVGRRRHRRRRPRRGRGRRGDGARPRPPPARPRSRVAPHALRRHLERGAVVPPPRAVRPRPPAPLRPLPPRGMGRLRGGQRGVRRRRRRRSAPERRAGAGARLPPRARPRRWCARPDPTCGSPTSPTRRSAAPTRSGCCPTDMAEAMCASMAAVPAGFHTARWARGVHERRRARSSADDRHAALRGAARPRSRRPRRRSRPQPATAARPPSSTSWSVTASSCCAATASTCRRTSCVASTCTTSCSTTHPEWRERVVFVAMLNRSRQSLAEYLAYEQEVDQAAARVERALGDAATGSRSWSTRATTTSRPSPGSPATTPCW